MSTKEILMAKGFAEMLKHSSIGNDKEKLDRVLNAKSATKWMKAIDEEFGDSIGDKLVKEAAKTIYDEFGFVEYVTWPDFNYKLLEKYTEFAMYLSFCL